MGVNNNNNNNSTEQATLKANTAFIWIYVIYKYLLHILCVISITLVVFSDRSHTNLASRLFFLGSFCFIKDWRVLCVCVWIFGESVWTFEGQWRTSDWKNGMTCSFNSNSFKSNGQRFSNKFAIFSLTMESIHVKRCEKPYEICFTRIFVHCKDVVSLSMLTYANFSCATIANNVSFYFNI